MRRRAASRTTGSAKGSDMARGSTYLVGLFAVVLMAVACGSSTTSGAPGASTAPDASTGAGEASPGASEPAQPTQIPVANSSGKPGDVELRWYCCLGQGDAPELYRGRAEGDGGVQRLASGHPPELRGIPLPGRARCARRPDRVGQQPGHRRPVGIGGANAFHGQGWLDLQPLIDKAMYEMKQFPASTVALYNVGGEGQVGIPFAVYPSALFYKASLFKEAGLNEPPHQWNGTYTMPDGSVVPWDYDTARKVALLLTVDENGKDATQAGFDPEKIVQWGFEPQRDDLRQVGAYWQAGSLVAADGKTAQIPDAWAKAWHWFYDGIWKDHIMVTGPQFLNTDFNPNNYMFFTGKVAMSENYMWSTYGVTDSGTDWNLAATPSYNGQTTAAFNADTFRILKTSKHPDEAFTVLEYLSGEAAPELTQLHGGFPARPSQQAAFFDGIQNQVDGNGKRTIPQTIDWKVIVEGAKYADVPNFESTCPGLQPDPRPDQHVRHQVAGHRGPGSRQGDRRSQDPAPGGLRQGRLLRRDRPRRRALAYGPAPDVRAGVAARALGLPLHRAVDHRVPAVHALPDDRDAGLQLHQHQPGPGGAAPVHRPQELPRHALRQAGLGLAAGDPQVRAAGLPVAVGLPFVVALMLHSRHLRGAGSFRVLFFLPYVVPFVAGVLIWRDMLNPDSGWIDGCAQDRRHRASA